MLADNSNRIVFMNDRQRANRSEWLGQIDIVNHVGSDDGIGFIEANIGVHRHEKVTFLRANYSIPAMVGQHCCHCGIIKLQ